MFPFLPLWIILPAIFVAGLLWLRYLYTSARDDLAILREAFDSAQFNRSLDPTQQAGAAFRALPEPVALQLGDLQLQMSDLRLVIRRLRLRHTQCLPLRHQHRLERLDIVGQRFFGRRRPSATTLNQSSRNAILSRRSSRLVASARRLWLPRVLR